MREFLSNIGVFGLKGIGLFLGFGLIAVITDALGITFYMDHIYPVIMSVSFEIRILIIFIVGAIAHYTFWRT
tara:strand:- start:452 stop:667 length:216 start_codon:yes stop_codon:yes gene_type:complete